MNYNGMLYCNVLNYATIELKLNQFTRNGSGHRKNLNKNGKKGLRRKDTSNLYWFTLPQGLRPVFLATLAKKISPKHSIVQLQSIT